MVLHLESDWKQLLGSDPSLLPVVLLQGLRYPGPYWVDLALSWIECECPIDEEILTELSRVGSESKKRLPQSTRHRAFALARRFERTMAQHVLQDERPLEPGRRLS